MIETNTLDDACKTAGPSISNEDGAAAECRSDNRQTAPASLEVSRYYCKGEAGNDDCPKTADDDDLQKPLLLPSTPYAFEQLEP